MISFNRLARSLSSDLPKRPPSAIKPNKSKNRKTVSFENTSNNQKDQVKSPKAVRYRDIFGSETKSILKKFFLTNKNPNKEEREKLAGQRNMTDKQLKVLLDYQTQNSKKRNETK